MKYLCGLITFLLFLTISLPAFGQDKQAINRLERALRELREKVQEQQDTIEELQESQESLQEELDDSRDTLESTEEEMENIFGTIAKMTSFNGYAVVEFFDRFNEKTTLADFTSLEKQNNAFRLRELSLITTIQPSRQFRLYAEILFSRFQNQFKKGLNAEEVVAIESAWLEYKPWPYLAVRVGKFYTYFGVWNRIRRKNLIVTIDSDAMGFIRQGVFEQRTIGAEVEYRKEVAKGFFQAMIWLSNGKRRRANDPTAVPETLNGLDLIDDDDKAVGGRIAFEFENLKVGGVNLQELMVGVSGYTGHVPQNTTDPTPELDAKVTSIFSREGGPYTPFNSASPYYLFNGEPVDGYRDRALNAHFKITAFNISFQAEYTHNFVDPDGRAVPSFSQFGYYFLLSYDFNPESVLGKTKLAKNLGRFTPFVLVDFLEANDKIKGEIAPKNRYIFGINWRLTEYFLLKFEYQILKFDRGNFRDFDAVAFQGVMSF